MSVERINGVAACSSAKGSELAILFILANHENQQTGECFPSIDTIAAQANLSRRAVQNNLRALEKNGEVIIVTGGIRAGQALANQYELTVPRLTGEEFSRALQDPDFYRAKSVTDRVQPATDQGEVHYVQGEVEYPIRVLPLTDEAYETAPQPEEEQEEELESEPPKFQDPQYREYIGKCTDWNEGQEPENSGRVEEEFTRLLEKGFTVGDLVAAYRGAGASGTTNLVEILVAEKIEDYAAADPMAADWRKAAA